MDNMKEYPFKSVLSDISNQRISIGQLISLVEKNEDFKMEIKEDGELRAYNMALEEVTPQWKQKDMCSDSLIMFRETMPKSLVDKGLADSPTKISKFVFDKISAQVANQYRNAHGYDKETLLQIKAALDDPLAVIRTKTKNGVPWQWN